MSHMSRFVRAKRITLFAIASLLSLSTLNVAWSAPEVGRTYYTQHNIWVEKERHIATNYSRGELIPLNTKVTLESMGSKKFSLDIDGRRITVVNVRKHTQRDTSVVADQLLAPRKVSLKGFSNERRTDIENGVMRLGMTKDQVIMTRGYPPRHKTPSIKANRWVYWTSKFVQLTLVFEGGKLARGRGLY